MLKKILTSSSDKLGYKNLLLNCSGGADSSMLLFETCKIIKELNLQTKIHVFTLGHDLKGRFNPRHVNQVINYIAEHFTDYPIAAHHVFYSKEPDEKSFKRAEKKIIPFYNIDIQLNATTDVPVNGEKSIDINGNEIDLYETCPVTDRADIQTTHPMISERMNTKFALPYMKLNKKDIAKKYEDFGVRDTLFPLTRSCESPADLTNNFTTTCGKCWWCWERKWAFGEY